jgi:hypothetical protein
MRRHDLERELIRVAARNRISPAGDEIVDRIKPSLASDGQPAVLGIL